MIFAVDVHYGASSAVVGGLTFADWHDPKPLKTFRSDIREIEDYIPGEFYKRELPCILKILNDFNIAPNTIIIDGYVFLDGQSRPGLGKYLFDALGGEVEIVGVAKNAFAGISDEFSIKRGKSQKPLYVTTTGSDVSGAKENIRAMYGPDRLPVLLKQVNQISRSPQ